MANRKSAAKVKPVKVEQPKDTRPIEQQFEEAREMFVMTVETQAKTARRVDNLLNLRDYAKKFWGEGSDVLCLDYYKRLQMVSVETYEAIADIAHSFELEDFLEETVKDYFEDLVPKVTEIESERELAEAGVVFLSVQPYGSKLVQMHQLIRDAAAGK